MKTSKLRNLLLALSLIVLSTSFASAQATQPAGVEFERIEAMVPMRDGVKLHTLIFAPKQMIEPLPILMTRTPYGIDGWNSARINGANSHLVPDGYIFVHQDIRGKYKSEGEFRMNRPPRDKSDAKSVDEASDTYDTIDWLIKNVRNNNGRVGIFGVSYPGWLAVVPLTEPHPALRALSPQAAMGDTWLGDDFFHQGAFRLSYGYEYVYGVESEKGGARPTFDTYDMFEWYLKQGAISNFLKPTLPTWKDFIEHPTFDNFWKSRSASHYLKDPAAPTLHVVGWFDQEDFYGPMKAYTALEKNDRQKNNFIVIGPWNHGGWRGGDGDSLGNIEFKSATGKHFREKIEAPWFAYHLKGKGSINQPEAVTFQTGSNEWKTYDQWPPTNLTTERKLYFHAGGKLSFDPPVADSDKEFDSYVSDPAHPVPYRHRPIEVTYSRGSRWSAWLTEDQRFVHNRPDVLTWETEPLKEEITVSGEIVAQLFASTSGTDSDWIVKLIDVYPQEWPDNFRMAGYQFMVTGEVLRGRYHKSFEKPEPLAPNKVTEFNVYLVHKDHSFKKGHRIMIQVQSTWFPVIDRNPQKKYVENIFKAKDADYIAATQRVFRSKRFASGIKLPVVNGQHKAAGN